MRSRRGRCDGSHSRREALPYEPHDAPNPMPRDLMAVVCTGVLAMVGLGALVWLVAAWLR